MVRVGTHGAESQEDPARPHAKDRVRLQRHVQPGNAASAEEALGNTGAAWGTGGSSQSLEESPPQRAEGSRRNPGSMRNRMSLYVQGLAPSMALGQQGKPAQTGGEGRAARAWAQGP